MKETPIIFSAPMVRAILDGRKTQTRRIVAPQPKNRAVFAEPGKTIGCSEPHWLDADGIRPGVVIPWRYGKPGDRLWVRETWGVMEGTICTDKTPHVVAGVGGTPKHYLGNVRVLAEHRAGTEKNAWGMYGPPKWHPSIHMPRTACRIMLEIVAVRIERLNAISASDAIAEGIEPVHDDYSPDAPQIGWHDYLLPESSPYDLICPEASFRSLWESINGKGSWAANPYVWAIEFRRVEA